MDFEKIAEDPSPIESSMPNLILDSVSKTFDGVRAVDDLSLEILPGEIYGLLGPNGAGKTTTIRTILGIFAPDSGTVQFGESGEAPEKDRIGYLPEERGLYPKMKVLELLRFLGEIKSLSRKDAVGQAESWLERFDLQDWRTRPLERLSKGMQQKVQFIATIMHDPDLLILDEPFSGLDPINMGILKDIMLELKSKEKVLIFSTHQMEEAERLCDRICLINKGRRVLEGSVRDVKAQYSNDRVTLSFEGQDTFLDDRDLVQKYDNYGNYVEVELKPGREPQELLERAMKMATVQRFEVSEPSLRDIFISEVGGDASEVLSDA